ncbi:MAG: hypothetical protein WBQ08_05995 [Candidatus Sulfotelmatobacter sp.]
MPSELSKPMHGLCSCASVIFLVAAGFSQSLGVGAGANLDCSKDVGCFVKPFDGGKPATVRQVTSISISGLTEIIGTYWQTRDFTGHKCTLYIRVDAVKCSLDEAAIKQNVASMGLPKETQETAVQKTMKQLEPMVQQMNDESAHHVGHDATCVFRTEELKDLIARWQKGETAENWSKKAENCQGSLLGDDEGSVSLAASVRVVPPPPEAAQTPTETKVKANYDDGPTVPFKPEEQRAFLFITAIDKLEGSVMSNFQSACPLGELIKGCPSKASSYAGLTLDPQLEKDYEYVVTVSGQYWTAKATPRRSGLGGFFDDVHDGLGHDNEPIKGIHFNPEGLATKNDKVISGWSIDGPEFLKRH